MNNYYKNLIWTNHALARMKERGLTQDMAADAFNHPDKSSNGSENNTFRYQKLFGKSKATIIAKQNEKSEWIIVSAWIDPPLPGSDDDRRQNAYRAYHKAPVWKKIFITVLRQLGLSRY